MTIWRPSNTIQVKAFGLAWREASILAYEVENDQGDVKGVRPLGGGVEFGETWQDTLKREFQEELGTEISISGSPNVMENIYDHHGVTGHEIIFLSNIMLLDKSLYSRGEISFFESDGTHCKARWYNLDDLRIKGPELYPNGLLDSLLKAAR